MDLVQDGLQRRSVRFIANGSVKANTGTDGKVFFFITGGGNANIDMTELLRIQNQIKGILRFCREMHSPGKIIAGTGGKVTQGNSFKGGKPAQKFIDGPVSAHYNDSAGRFIQ